MNCFDIIGPVMIGPSSSHTAGAARIGRIVGTLLGEQAAKAEILLSGSFAQTYKGHGTDKAVIAGILGMDPDDARLPQSLIMASQLGVEVTFQCISLTDTHPNTAIIRLTSPSGRTVSIQGSSVGGGNIKITRINNLPASFDGEHAVLIVEHMDIPGMIAAVTGFLADEEINICNFRLSREEKGKNAIMMIETDKTLPKAIGRRIEAMEHILSVTLLPARGYGEGEVMDDGV